MNDVEIKVKLETQNSMNGKWIEIEPNLAGYYSRREHPLLRTIVTVTKKGSTTYYCLSLAAAREMQDEAVRAMEQLAYVGRIEDRDEYWREHFLKYRIASMVCDALMYLNVEDK